MNKTYIPKRGDVVRVNFNPSKGSEQKGRRPAIILTPKAYNTFGLCYIVPITSSIKGYSIEVKINANQKTNGVILTNQMMAMDWRAREIEFIEKIQQETLDTIDSRLRTILSL
jgi:mRNA interferase MazF